MKTRRLGPCSMVAASFAGCRRADKARDPYAGARFEGLRLVLRTRMPSVELNIDLGELPGEPAELFALATTVNVACGGHAGDKASMARALSFAMARGARVAAHPSYPDREGFGRTSMAIAPADLARAIEEQCAALATIARRLGYAVARVKPHGALYHDAARDPAIAAALLDGAARGLGAAGEALTVI